MRCDDFICLGRTVPEESKKYGAKVCMAGISPELGILMRVYPLPVQNPIVARHQCVLELERNHQDNRRESWKLRDQGSGILSVSPRPVLDGEMIAAALRPFLVRSIEDLNEKRMSLGVITAEQPRGLFRERKNGVHPDQGMLFEIADEVFGAGAIDLAPYIEFWDQDSRRHELQIREWGCYRWLQKERHRASQLWDNLRLGASPQTLLVIGNQVNRRTSWLIVKTFNVVPVLQGSLF